jgi:hypothetical protein
MPLTELEINTRLHKYFSEFEGQIFHSVAVPYEENLKVTPDLT